VFLIDRGVLLYDNHFKIMLPMPGRQIPILLLAASNHRLTIDALKAAGAWITARSVRALDVLS
jgi:hypothetical protein